MPRSPCISWLGPINTYRSKVIAIASRGDSAIGDMVDMTVGSTITYTVSGTIASSAVGTLLNTVDVAVPEGVFVDPDPSDNTVSLGGVLQPNVDVSLTLTDGITSVAPTTRFTYTITITNDGPSDLIGATVSDAFPPLLTGVTYTSTAVARSTAIRPTASAKASRRH